MSAKELNIGDYVRTTDGEIGKIIECPEVLKENYGDWLWFETIDGQRPTIKENIIKSSPNIIDLIETGDYVNGMQVTRICFDEDGERILNLSNCYLELMNDDIKSILTKEQFESMEYKVE